MKFRKAILPAMLMAMAVLTGRAVHSDGTDSASEAQAFRPGEVVVELRPGASIAAVNQRHRTTTLQHIYGTNFYRLGTPKNKKEKKWRKKLERDEEVLSAALNPVITNPSVFARVTVSFPDGFAKPGMTLADFEAQQGLFDLLQLAEIKQRSSGRDTVVAVIDTGIDASHPALAGKLWVDARPNADLDGDRVDKDGDGLIDDGHGWDFVDNDKDPSEVAGDPTKTVAGHGTFIAGIITTLAPECRILPIRAFPPDGISDGFTVASAIKYAADHGANVINLSLGSDVPLALLKDAILDARGRGITLIAAVGNENSDLAPQFPSTMDEVMAVAAIDLAGKKAAFSNYGAHVDVCAPGVNLISAYPSANRDDYAQWSGTSFAAPFAAAEAALVIAADPQVADVKKTIESTAVNLDALNPQFAGELGKGRLDPLLALKSLDGARPIADVHLQMDLSRGPAGGDAYGQAKINVSGATQELKVEAYNLPVRALYTLVINGAEIASNLSANLGSLRFAFTDDARLNPVTKIARVELRDSLGRIALQGDFNIDVAPAPRFTQKEARLVPTGVLPQAGGRTIVRIESLQNDQRRETFLITADGLLPNTQYRVLVDGVNLGTLSAPFGYLSARFTSDNSSGVLLPPVLKPVTNIRRVDVLDARGLLVMQALFAVNPI